MRQVPGPLADPIIVRRHDLRLPLILAVLLGLYGLLDNLGYGVGVSAVTDRELGEQMHTIWQAFFVVGGLLALIGPRQRRTPEDVGLALEATGCALVGTSCAVYAIAVLTSSTTATAAAAVLALIVGHVLWRQVTAISGRLVVATYLERWGS